MCCEPVELTPARFVELVKANQKPRCVKNGCARLFPKTKFPPAALDILKVQPRIITWPKHKKGNRNGALPKLHIQLDDTWRTETVRKTQET